MSDMRRGCHLTGVRSPTFCWTARVVGVDFDPGYLLKRLRSGEKATELLKQGAGTGLAPRHGPTSAPSRGNRCSPFHPPLVAPRVCAFVLP